MKSLITSTLLCLGLNGCYLGAPPSIKPSFRSENLSPENKKPEKTIDSIPKTDQTADKPTIEVEIEAPPVDPILTRIRTADALRAIQADALKLNPSDQGKTRYFTLQTISNAGKSAGVLDAQRAAFKKTINSLSTKAALVKPPAVDKDKIIYRLNLDDLNIDVATFDKIIAEFYPFAGSHEDIGTADSIAAERADKDLKEILGTDIYLIRMDWFNATATLPVLYQKLLALPTDLSDFEEQILGEKVALTDLGSANATSIEKLDKSLIKREGGVNKVDRRIANILKNDVLRTGFDNSNVSFSNRIIERHAIAEGSYWITYDFFNLKAGDLITDAKGNQRQANQADLDKHNINKSPLGPLGTNGAEREFNHDGGEVIYSLPNGLFGYYLIDAKGTLLDKGPLNVVRQNSGPAEFSNAITNGLSCMSCHNTGLLKQADTIVSGLNANRSDLSAEDFARINRIYNPSNFNAEMDKDNARYNEAMKALGVDVNKPDPVDQAFRLYNRALTKADVMAELDFNEKEFAQLLVDPEFNGIFNALNTPQGSINRGVFQGIYSAVVASYKQDFKSEAPKLADFVVTVDCMALDLVQMDKCVINPLELNLSAFVDR